MNVAMKAILFFFSVLLAQNLVFCKSTGIHLDILVDHVVIDNGIFQLNLSKPEGKIIGLGYAGNANLIETRQDSSHGGYYDLNWGPEGSRKTSGKFDKTAGTVFKVIVQNEQQVEISFSRTWDSKQKGQISPLNIDKRFVVLSNSSGFYSYAIFEHTKDMPAFNMNTARIAFILNRNMFKYMAVADNIQRHMPDPDDRKSGEPLEYKEAVRLTKPLDPKFKGEVDDKYEYSKENIVNQVHGWISFESGVGFWQITPSNEFRTSGPFKQDLTSHVGPATLAVFVSTHYAGLDNVVKFKDGEVWKKVFGPVFIYLNKVADKVDPRTLWDDAKKQMKNEVESWPQNFPASVDFPKAGQRGTVSGRLLVKDMFISKENMPANGTYVGLAPPGEAGSWQHENKGYQFWTTTDKDGQFTIKNIVVGEYNLFASVPGFIGDYRLNNTVKITSAGVTKLGDVVYEPPRNGPTLWEIGYPDRLAEEFNVPAPNPSYINKLFVNHPDRFRQYGIWERYEELYPKEDLVYTVGTSDYKKDWFYAHVTRKAGNGNYTGTTWQIRFKLKKIAQTGTYKLRLALASAHASELQVRVNDAKTTRPLFSTGLIGKDNAIARHGIHGIYYLFDVDIPSALLASENNTIYLTQTQNTSPYQGIMYDYLRLEGPPNSEPAQTMAPSPSNSDPAQPIAQGPSNSDPAQPIAQGPSNSDPAQPIAQGPSNSEPAQTIVQSPSNSESAQTKAQSGNGLRLSSTLGAYLCLAQILLFLFF